jgi:hypothetical protein
MGSDAGVKALTPGVGLINGVRRFYAGYYDSRSVTRPVAGKLVAQHLRSF